MELLVWPAFFWPRMQSGMARSENELSTRASRPGVIFFSVQLHNQRGQKLVDQASKAGLIK
jgi:hypothetical protein